MHGVVCWTLWWHLNNTPCQRNLLSVTKSDTVVVVYKICVGIFSQILLMKAILLLHWVSYVL